MAVALKLARKNISGMLKPVLMAQTLRNMRGHSTIAQTLTILASLTKAVFGLEKLWKLGTPQLLSMLTITPSRFQTSIVFFLRNSHLISTFSLCFYPYFSFYLTFSVYIIFIFYSFLSVEGCRATAESSCSFNILSQ